MKRRVLETVGALAFGISALALALHYGWDGSVSEPEGPSGSATVAAGGGGETAEPPVQAVQRPRIEVVFALDTTGSMGGLIEGAKRKIWSLANKLASGEPRPDIRIGLVAYRDIGDAYVTQRVAMTDDLDEVYGALMQLTAAGGGDGPEHVNQALDDALHRMDWSDEPNTLRLVFLVGDAPPHDDYDDGMTAASLADKARARGIIINTVRCGGNADTEAAWKVIAARAGGDYSSIVQDGGMRVQETPYDAQLAALNASLAGTVLGWGSAEEQAASRDKMTRRRAMHAPAAAEAASYAAKSGKLNSEDLIGALDAGLELEKVREEALPEALRGKDAAAQRALIEEKRADRKKLQADILELSRQRDAYLKAESSEGADGFDDKVMENVARQAAEIGVAY